MTGEESRIGMINNPVMTAAICRQARELLGWSRGDLAARAFVSSGTVKNLEEERTKPSQPILSAIRTALQAAGVNIDGSAGGEPQLTLTKYEAPSTEATVGPAALSGPLGVPFRGLGQF